jgi:hypothetical protein
MNGGIAILVTGQCQSTHATVFLFARSSAIGLFSGRGPGQTETAKAALNAAKSATRFSGFVPLQGGL